MGKEEIFSKLNIKDYNNQLEKILEKKSFSEATKNILLNILYKIEIAYDDYSKVKVDTKSKKEILEEVLQIIQYNCNEIEIVKPKLNEETKLGNKKYIVEKNNKKIISYPNEKSLFFGIYNLKDDEFTINTKYNILKEPLEIILRTGYILDKEEIIRDFDGWAWNISKEDIEDYTKNLVYQNIKILIGENKIKECINSNSNDFIDKFEREILNICNEELGNKILSNIYTISILEYIMENYNNKKYLIKIKNDAQKDLEKLENKQQYLQELANKKKKIGKEIKQIDELNNNTKLLKQAFINHNSKLEDKDKIFSLSQYSELIQENRKNALIKLKEYSMLMKPMNYLKTKAELKKKVDILEKINFEEGIEEQNRNKVFELQQDFLEALKLNAIDTQNKKDILRKIYLFRYYKLLAINKDNQIKDIEMFCEKLKETEKFLITKGCKIKAINIISSDIQKNYEIVSKILDSNIIKLEEIQIELKKQNDKNILNIYDENIIDNSIEISIQEINIKPNKKIKLFV